MNLSALLPKIVTVTIESKVLGDAFPPVQVSIGLPTLYNWNSFADGLRMPEAPVTGINNRGEKFRDEYEADYLRKMREYNDIIMYRRVTYALAKGGNEFPGAVLFDEQVEWTKQNIAAFIVFGIHQFLLNSIMGARAQIIESVDNFRPNGTHDPASADATPPDAADVEQPDGQPTRPAAEARNQTPE